jgi:hypothetical protein
MGTEKERERYVYLAKLSEQAERYDGTFPWPRVCVGSCVIIVAFVCSFVSFAFPHDCLYYGLLVDALGCRSFSGVMAEKCPTFF